MDSLIKRALNIFVPQYCSRDYTQGSIGHLEDANDTCLVLCRKAQEVFVVRSLISDLQQWGTNERDVPIRIVLTFISTLHRKLGPKNQHEPTQSPMEQ